MSDPIPPTTEPTKISAGNTLTFSKTLSDYPAGGGWQLSYALRGPANISLAWGVVVSADGDGFLVNVPAATTATWTPGNYWFFAFLTHTDGRRFPGGDGEIKILPNQATASGAYDGRTHAQKVLAAIEAMMEGTASREEQSLSVTSATGTTRDLQFFPRSELILLQKHYQALRNKEILAEKSAQGKRSGRTHLVRFR